MKINGDISSKNFIEKNETQGRASKNSKTAPGKNAAVAMTEDELELTSRKAAVLDVSHTGNSTLTDYETDNVEDVKAILSDIKSLMLANPSMAISAQANLKSETIASLIG